MLHPPHDLLRAHGKRGIIITIRDHKIARSYTAETRVYLAVTVYLAVYEKKGRARLCLLHPKPLSTGAKLQARKCYVKVYLR